MKNADMPAHPSTMRAGDVEKSEGGLTKREHFAAMAMQGILANPTGQQEPEGAPPEAVIEIVALASVNFADALLAELERTK